MRNSVIYDQFKLPEYKDETIGLSLGSWSVRDKLNEAKLSSSSGY